MSYYRHKKTNEMYRDVAVEFEEDGLLKELVVKCPLTIKINDLSDVVSNFNCLMVSTSSELVKITDEDEIKSLEILYGS